HQQLEFHGQIPRSARSSAISLWTFARLLRQRPGSQTSRWSELPMTTASFLRPAYSRRCAGMVRRPCASGSASCAPARMKCLKRVAFGSVRGRLVMSVLRSIHSDSGKTARHSPPLTQRVTTAPSLKRRRNFAGMARRPLSSSEWANSPAKKPSNYPSRLGGGCPTLPHYSPRSGHSPPLAHSVNRPIRSATPLRPRARELSDETDKDDATTSKDEVTR